MEVRKGYIVQFGSYPLEANGQSHTPIDWLVLEVKDGKALLFSKYGLDCRKYNEEDDDTTWEECTLRHWLNQDFLHLAFSETEQKRISTVSVPADPNPRYDTSPGSETKDQIFLLSIPEAEKYFSEDEQRQCVPTAYAIAQGALPSSEDTNDGTETCWWWLRSPGCYQSSAAGVKYGGSLNSFGYFVSFDNGCVRPALWLNPES